MNNLLLWFEFMCECSQQYISALLLGISRFLGYRLLVQGGEEGFGGEQGGLDKDKEANRVSTW